MMQLHMPNLNYLMVHSSSHVSLQFRFVYRKVETIIKLGFHKTLKTENCWTINLAFENTSTLTHRYYVPFSRHSLLLEGKKSSHQKHDYI